MPIAVRSDWVQNSNDSFYYTHPQQKWSAAISPLVGDASLFQVAHARLAARDPEMLAARQATPGVAAAAALSATATSWAT